MNTNFCVCMHTHTHIRMYVRIMYVSLWKSVFACPFLYSASTVLTVTSVALRVNDI